MHKKTVRQHLREIQDPEIKMKALQYFYKQRNLFKNRRYRNTGVALINAFIWSETKEGYNFWYEVYNSFFIND